MLWYNTVEPNVINGLKTKKKTAAEQGPYRIIFHAFYD